jgi:hypothetical protein
MASCLSQHRTSFEPRWPHRLHAVRDWPLRPGPGSGLPVPSWGPCSGHARTLWRPAAAPGRGRRGSEPSCMGSDSSSRCIGSARGSGSEVQCHRANRAARSCRAGAKACDRPLPCEEPEGHWLLLVTPTVLPVGFLGGTSSDGKLTHSAIKLINLIDF